MKSSEMTHLHVQHMHSKMDKILNSALHANTPDAPVSAAIARGLQLDPQDILRRQIRRATATMKSGESPFVSDGVGLALYLAPDLLIEECFEPSVLATFNRFKTRKKPSSLFKQYAKWPYEDYSPEYTIADKAIGYLAVELPRYSYRADYNPYQIARRTFQATYLGLYAVSESLSNK